jgi:glycosyltransferase involved in cell wall biosynthesis
MLVGVCDFPGDYAFPPKGYGGIERWLWAVAVGARKAGADVHLLGPQWRHELADNWTVRPVRLEDVTPGGRQASSLRDTGYDLLVVGHEYPSLPAWRATWETLDCDVATFQHWPYFEHQADAFDGVWSRLYTYSEEMRERYAVHRPIRELAVHLGLDETELAAHDGDDLLWMGRIDAEKSTHLAIRAAQLLGRRITVAGPVFDAAYVDAHRELFGADHVTVAGEVGGEAKMRLLAEAGVLLYTCARHYIEAGAATFGESLRAGTPVAALAWRPGTCAQAALCEGTGSIAVINPEADDEIAAQALADVIEQATPLRARDVQEIGLARFDPVRHFQAHATRPC